jgi:putative ABC transport system permease protein
MFRDLSSNRTRTLISILGVALGVAVMLAINLANGSALSRFEESINLVAGKSNLEIVPSAQADLSENILHSLRVLQDQGVLLTPIIDQLAVVPGDREDVVEVLGVDMLADDAFRPFDLQEDKKSGLENGIFSRASVYLAEKFAQRYGLKEKGRLSLLINDRKRDVKVQGILSPSGPGEAFGGNVALMDIGSAQDVFDMHGRISRVDLLVPPDRVAAVMDQINAMNIPAIAVERPSRRGKQVEKMLSAFQYNLAALSLIALLVGMFVIYNTMSMAVVRKRSEIGVLRALGASRRHLLSIFLCQALLLGIAGSLLGLIAGSAFAHLAVKAVATTVQALYVDQPPAEVALSWQPLLVSFLIGVCLTVIAGLAPAVEAMSVSAAEAARRGSFERRVERGSPAIALCGCLLILLAVLAATLPAVNGFPVFGYLSAALIIFGIAMCLPVVLSAVGSFIQPLWSRLFGNEGRLAMLGLTGSLGRTSVAVASLMLGIAMMISLAIMIASFRQTVIIWVGQSLKADIYVAPLARATSKRAGRLSDSTVDAIKRLPGIEDVDAFVEFPINYHGDTTNLAAADLDVLAKHGGLMFTGGRNSSSVLAELIPSVARAVSATVDGGCIVSESFALRNNVRSGDTIELGSPSGAWRTVVRGVYYDYASERGYVILPRWLYRKHFPDLFSSTMGVYLKPNASLDAVRSEIAHVLGSETGLSIRSNAQLRHEVLRVFDNTFAITYALHAVSVAVAILGVMNALFALTFESRREFALLKCLGASLRQIRKLILVQAATLGLIGTVLGIGVGFLLSLLLIHVINKQSFAWTIQLSLPIAFLVQSFLLVMASSLVSGILPARTAASVTPAVLNIE